MKLLQGLLLCMLISTSVLAQEINVTGTIHQTIKPPRSLQASLSSVKHIALLKIELSDKAKQRIIHKADIALAKEDVPKNTGKKIQLGMGNVPVLDQGSYGSCVTFANTAAIDAVVNKGDYVSQLCQLQLGRYLEENGYVPSGWNGSLGGIVLNQMTAFGLVSKAQQMAHGCGGLTQYPSSILDVDIAKPMTPEEYHQISEEPEIAWSPIVDIYQVILDKTNMDVVLEQVKATLNAGDRLTFGILLPSSDRGVAGAIGNHKNINDSWLLTPEILEDMESQRELPGHEMIITGFDDDAIATDDHGHEHKGLLTLRNSWGTNIGDKGDFYMSYDYFKVLVIEAQRIRHEV